MPVSRAKGANESPKSVEMTDMSTTSPAVATVAMALPTITNTTAATAALPTNRFASLPASPSYNFREEVAASATMMEGGNESADALRIRVWYLDGVFSRAEPRFVPDVDTLKRLLPESDLAFPLASSPTTVGDHFAEFPYRQPTPSAAATGRDGAQADRQSYPSISLRPSSPTRAGGHPAWVSVKAASQAELTEILDWLPIHVLTRRRILSILCKHDVESPQTAGEAGKAPPIPGETVRGARASTSAGQMGRNSRLSGGGSANEPPEPCGDPVDSGSDSDDGEGETRQHHATARDNFLEYFPAHGYAVLCLQAVPMPRGESTRRGATPKEELISHGTLVPNTPVVALAFESTLFTFSHSRFGGEGDVRLIVANHIASPTAHSARHGMPARVTTIATISSTMTPPENERNRSESMPMAAADGMTDPNALAFEDNASPVETIPHNSRRAFAAATRSAMSTALGAPPANAREARNVSPPPTLSYPRHASAASQLTYASSPSQATESTSMLGVVQWNAATAISVVCSSLISAIIAYLQQSTRSLLMEADQLDELVLQIRPSRVDQDDLLVRTKSIRNLMAAFHIDALQKERVLKQLLLPAMRQTPLAQSMQAVERYQRSLSSVRSTVLKLRKGRDIVNMASMTLISGVSARLLTHCNFMDYLNHVQTQIAVVVMPIAVIPGIFATNVKVPWEDSTSMVPFYCLLTITLSLMVIGLAPPLYKFFRYPTPKALAPLD